MPDPQVKGRSRALTSKVLFHVLKVLAESDGLVAKQEIHRRLLADLDFTEWESEEAGKSRAPRWRSALWYTTDASRAGFMEKSGGGQWRITASGREALNMQPLELLDAARAGYKEWRQSHAGSSTKRASSITRGQVLRASLQLLERTAGRMMFWREVSQRITSLLPEETLEELEAKNADWQGDFTYSTFARATRAGFLVRDRGNLTLTDAGLSAMQEWPAPEELWEAARQSAGRDPEEGAERIPYLGKVVNSAGTPQTLYHVHQDHLGHMMGGIQQGTLALPDIQRPFVWKNTKVRDLLDSLFRGFPFGYLLTWKSPEGVAHATLGGHASRTALPDALVIDGQQRLTSLFAVMAGKPVMDKEFRQRRIKIAFHPISARFEVSDAAINRNREWIPDLSEVFTNEMGALDVVQRYLKNLAEVRDIEPEHRQAVETNVNRLVNLRNLPVTVLQIGARANEEQVAEIFVRINSQGQRLNQADFILTLLAVFWEEGRQALEEFAKQCRIPSVEGEASPFNHKLQPGPDALVRVVVAVGHRRARLSAAYQVLRGKDARTGEISAEAREKNLNGLSEAQAQALSPIHWHEYLKILSSAGFRHKKLIWSEITALFGYSLYLIGKTQFDVPADELRRIIGRWYMMAVVTSRYVGGSSESAMEEDLARLRDVEGAAGFVQALERAMESELTRDFWEVTLPSRMESSSTRSLAPFFAAQSVLGSKALYSNLTMTDLFDPTRVSTKSDLEIHHLFPKAWLQRNGITSPKEYNQIANMGLLEWQANIAVSDEDPKTYVPRLEGRLMEKSNWTEADLAEANRLHALPEEWWEMDYEDFLQQRRELMADLIREAFHRVG
jgi:hypothetical protein